jgi:hypothetical protein
VIKARFVHDECLRTLRGEVGNQLARYRSGQFDSLANDASLFFEGVFPIDDEALKKLEPSNQAEVPNCMGVLAAMPDLTPYDARDERLWVYLTHTTLLDYARQRWPIPDDDADAEKHIRKHFFANDRRQMERDNAASRLWWMGHLCQRVEGLSLEEALKAFLFKSDVRANIIERPTISQATNVFAVIVKRLWASFNGKQELFDRTKFRDLMMEINSVGGFKLLDCLSEHDIGVVVDDAVQNRLMITAL